MSSARNVSATTSLPKAGAFDPDGVGRSMGAALLVVAETAARAGPDFDVDILLDSALIAGHQLRANHHDRHPSWARQMHEKSIIWRPRCQNHFVPASAAA
jgi:hypothetical protein